MRRLVAVWLLCVLGLAGCGGAGAPVPAAGSVPLRVTAVLPHDDLAYWSAVATGIRQGGAEFGVDVKISLPQLNYSIPQMTELVRAATAARVDGLIVQGIEDEDYLQALRSARAAGIQVVLVDTDLPGFERDLYVGTDNYAAGRSLGQQIVARTSTARIAVISGAPAYPNLELRVQGIRDAIAGTAGLQIVDIYYNHYDSLTTMACYQEILASGQAVDTIVCVEGTGGMVFSTMQQPRDAAIKLLIAFDLSRESEEGLRGGVLDVVMQQENTRMGEVCVEEIYRRATSGHYSAQTIYTGVQALTAGDLPPKAGDADE